MYVVNPIPRRICLHHLPLIPVQHGRSSSGAKIAAKQRVGQFTALTCIVAQHLPLVAVKPMHNKLLDWSIVGKAGVESDPGQKKPYLHFLEMGGLVHNAFAPEIVAALFQYISESVGPRISGKLDLRWPAMTEAGCGMRSSRLCPVKLMSRYSPTHWNCSDGAGVMGGAMDWPRLRCP